VPQWAAVPPLPWLAPDAVPHRFRCKVTASGSPTLEMLVEMLVERVFLFSGVVKTVFSRIKKKIRDFFVFFTTYKRK